MTMVCGSYKLGHTGLQGALENGVREGVVDGIRVIELVMPYSNADHFLKRSMTFLRFSLRSIQVAMRTDYDLLFATSTPLTAGIPGIAMKLFRRRRPFIFEVRDLWPDLPRAMGVIKNPLILASMGALEWCSYHAADACVGLAPGIVEGVVNRGIDRERVKMIPNGADLDLFKPRHETARARMGVGDGDFVALFSGAHGLANGLDAVLDAARVLKSRGVQKIKIVLIGDGMLKARLMKRAEAEGLDNCIFLNPVPKREMAAMMASADVGLMVLANVPAFYFGTSPNKFFDYLASGIPILNNYPGWLAGLIREHKCGVVVPPNAPGLFADALIQMADDGEWRQVMGRNARALAGTVFDRKKLVRETADLIESVHSSYQIAGHSGEGRLFYRFLKRSLDVTVALVGLTLLSPMLLGIFLAVRTRLGSPVLFRQVRPGYQGKPITVYKFRTMHDSRDVHGTLLPDAERLTLFGNWLRRFSLDELPQLFNVLRGDMSLVGPRPLLMEYVPLYNREQIRRHEVKPGITGWAQVNGRNMVRWEDQFALDAWYVNHRTMWLDLKILGMTVLKTIRPEGISQEKHPTRERFRGSPS